MPKHAQNLIWVDLEMTGLLPESDKIIEIAVVITDSQLAVLAEGPVIAVHQSSLYLDNMDEWNTKQHTQSGLVERVKMSSITEGQAEQEILDFLANWVPANASPMCGNSICQDRRFLCRYMPKLANFFHYRNLDVSTLKILAERWAPEVFQGVKKESKHVALNDIHDSIAELAYYRKHFLRTAVTL